MYLKVPFEKELLFSTEVEEITKISLENDYNVNDDEILGNFYVSGEYKRNEISVNKEEFKFTIPFDTFLTEDIEKESLEFNIEDFNYELFDNKLKVNIEYSIKADIKDNTFKKIDEKILDEEISFIDNFMENEREEKNDEERIDNVNKDIILGEIDNMKEDFITYHIHIVKENETIENIEKIYSVDSNIVYDMNNTNKIIENDKLIIPIVNE